MDCFAKGLAIDVDGSVITKSFLLLFYKKKSLPFFYIPPG